MPELVYADDSNTSSWLLLTNPHSNTSPTIGDFWSEAREHEPLSVEVEKDMDDVFIEPVIVAEYFALVDLEIGAQWVVTDYRGRAMFLCRVDRKEPDPLGGTVKYRFITEMSYLATAEPAGILTTAEDAGLGPDATPNEVLTYLFNKWNPEINISLAPDPPTIELRGASGPITPYVYSLALEQTIDSSRTFLGWLDEYFAPFAGYAYDLRGRQLHVIAPYWQQVGALLVEENNVVSVVSSSSSDTIVNSQLVRCQPMVKVGTFSYVDGEPESPNDLPEIADPIYYRQGDTNGIAPPSGRLFRKNGVGVKIRYSADKIPVVPPIRVTWTAHVWMIEYYNNDTRRVIPFSEGLLNQTHVIDLNAGQEIHLPSTWKEGFLASGGGDWAWSISYSEDGESVKATLITPGETIEIPSLYGGIQGIETRKLGAEFHLSVQGQAYEQSPEVYSAHFGYYTPPTMPPGVDPPPIETAGSDDADVMSSYLLYGKRSGRPIDLRMWTLIPNVSLADALLDAITNGNYQSARETILKTALDIAQHSVKENIAPYTDLRLELIPPFSITLADIGKLVQYDAWTGILRSYKYREAYSLGSRLVRATLGLKVRETVDRQPITIIPYEPPPPTVIPGPDAPNPDPPTSEPPPPVTAGPGMVQIELGERFDLLKLIASTPGRIRLYRTDAARTADASRPLEEDPEEGSEVEQQLILEANLIAGDLELDLHAILGHTPEGVVYANIEAGEVTFHRFMPEGFKL